VNQRDIGAALGINQATVARALKRAVNLGLITEKEVEDCAKSARALRDDTVRVAFGDEGDREINPDF
jgi:DNA-binding transcriptional regulator LsrR (DeoR family)